MTKPYTTRPTGAGAADQAAAEAPAPLCRCHGQPMQRRGGRQTGWRCHVKQLEYQRRNRRRHPNQQRKSYLARKAAGVCVRCRDPILVTETRCYDCANRLCAEAIRYR